jgi:hypothetical protein
MPSTLLPSCSCALAKAKYDTAWWMKSCLLSRGASRAFRSNPSANRLYYRKQYLIRLLAGASRLDPLKRELCRGAFLTEVKDGRIVGVGASVGETRPEIELRSIY